ncbi:MAG: TIR domain-containing protein, partial [Blastocatellales bacterium]
MNRPLVFISYSHKDEKWKDLLVGQLNVLREEALLDAWDDRRIEFGNDWEPRIIEAINSAAAAVLLITVDFLNSKFIKTKEIPALLERRANDGLKIFPVIVSDCPWRRVSWLNPIQSLPKDGRALSDFRGNARNKALSEIATIIADLLNPPSSPPGPAREASAQLPPEPYQKVPTLPPSKLFVGRKDQMEEIEKRLRSRGVVGVVSLKGTAGVGKSALALEAAYRFAALFPDGRYWVDLRGGDAANAVRALLRHLGVSVPPDSRFDDLIFAANGALTGRRALIILDNAEAIPAADCARLLELCATTIVTSRLAIDPINDIRVDELPDEDALELLRGCGVDVEAERDDALKLIERLGGLALAIEITAKRMAMHQPRQSCARALEELKEGRHLVEAIKLPGGDKREDNIIEAFALSYDLLDDELKSAFHAVGLCAESGAPIAAVARMLGLEVAEARELLLLLTKYSLAAYGAERVVTHPLLHDYARMCVQRSSDLEAEMIEQHVRYFGSEIGGAFQQAIDVEDGEGQMTALKLIDAASDNVILAQTRALGDEFNNPALAAELTVGLWQYWRLRDEPQLLDWLLRAQPLFKQVGDKLGQANVLKAIGDVQSFRKEMDAALSSYSEALTLFKQVGDKLGQANVLQAIGDVQSFRKEMDAALSSYSEALTLFKQVGDKLGQANVLQA